VCVPPLAGTRLDHILRDGVLQVGYRPNNLACSFLTQRGELVGFDVEMAHILAEDLGVELEFVPFEFDSLGRMLQSGQMDMAMSCIASLPDRYAYALMLSAEEGSAYSYRYPRYTVARVRSGGIRLPAAYAIPKGDVEMMEFVSNWIELKRKDGTIDSLYEYWMLGGASRSQEPRWSIIRNVLGWVD